MNTAEVVLFVMLLIGSIIGIGIVRGICRRVDATRIVEDGRERQLSAEERMAFASHAALERGRWFRLLLLSGAILVLACSVILWHLGFIGN